MRIFLIAGKSGSGKDEVAKLINEYYIYKLDNCAVTGFSKYLKLFAKELTDWDGNDATKPRKFLQQLGDEVRKIDRDFLISNMIQDMQVYENHVQNLIINDVRMPEEIEQMKENFDEVYSICVENQFSNSTLSIEEQSHNTETALDNYDDFDLIIANDDLNGLKDKVFNFLDGIK